MGNRRFAQVSTSDDEEEDDVVPPRQQSPSSSGNQSKKRKRKQTKLLEEEEEPEEDPEEDEEEQEAKKPKKKQKKKTNRKKKKKKKKKEDDDDDDDDDDEDEDEEEDEEKEEAASPQRSEEEEEPVAEDAKPIGELIKTTGKGRSKRNHYEAFEYDGNQYDLEDPVLIVPESRFQKPYVAIIKDIAQDKDGSLMVTGQWFYRPEEAEKKGGGNWQSNDTRELFYSFHRDEVPAESVMHRCVVHFVPLHKQLPNRKQYPGFFVRKVYDAVEKKLWKLTDKDYEDKKQHEIDLLVEKTMQRLVDLPDIEPEDNNADQEDHLMKAKRSLRRKNISPLDVSREEEATRPDQHPKSETPGSCPTSEYYSILANFNVLTGETPRDRWLERLLQCVQYVCNSADSMNKDDKEKAVADGNNHESDSKHLEAANGSQDKSPKSGNSFSWPDAAVPAVVALEKASHESLSSDFQKYNQKLRQLSFNLKNNVLLAQRLLNGELEPLKILNMSPIELKEGLTAEEMAKKEPDESERMQMTDARCSRCSEFKVGVRDIIQAGHGERYQLECIACGHSWYASRDDAATLTIDAPSSSKNVGTAPWATAKFENVEKKLVSPRESDRAATDVFKKTSEAYMPVLETQKSFIKPKKEENPETPKSAIKKEE